MIVVDRMKSFTKATVAVANLSLVLVLILPFLMTQHNWPLVGILQFVIGIILVISCSTGIILCIARRRHTHKAVIAFSFLPVIMYSILLLHLFAVPEIDAEIHYLGPSDSVEIEYAMKYGSIGSVIEKDGVILEEDVGDFNRFFVRTNENGKMAEVVPQNSRIGRDIPIWGKRRKVIIAIEGNSYHYEIEKINKKGNQGSP